MQRSIVRSDTGQVLDAIEQKGIPAEQRQFAEAGFEPPQLHRASGGGFGASWRLRIAGEREALARVTQTDSGLTGQILRQIGGDAKEVRARLFEGGGVLRLLTAAACARRG